MFPDPKELTERDLEILAEEYGTLVPDRLLANVLRELQEKEHHKTIEESLAFPEQDIEIDFDPLD